MAIRHILLSVSAMPCWKRALAIAAFFLCLPMVGSGMVPGVFSGLVGNGTAADNLAVLEADLNDLKGEGW